MNNFNPSISYLKALGIMLMVLGHACFVSLPMFPQQMPFINMFHMPIFFISAGYCFNDKYIDLPKIFLKNKLNNIWWPYVKWCIVFLCLHNFFYNINIYNNQYTFKGEVSHLYSVTFMLHKVLIYIFRMQDAEQLLAGYWFLKALFFASIISWIFIRFIRNPILSIGVLFTICFLLNMTCWFIPIIQISTQPFAGALLFLLGYYFARYKVKIFSFKVIFLSLSLTYVGSYYWSMSMNQLTYDNMFFPFYICTALLATWSFYSIFEHLRRLYYFPNMFFNFIGKNTLTILTWHLLAFKVVSLMIIYIYELPMKRLAEFPVILEYSHKGWWIVYFIVAILVTGGIAYCNKGIKNQWLKL